MFSIAPVASFRAVSEVATAVTAAAPASSANAATLSFSVETLAILMGLSLVMGICIGALLLLYRQREILAIAGEALEHANAQNKHLEGVIDILQRFVDDNWELMTDIDRRVSDIWTRIQ